MKTSPRQLQVAFVCAVIGAVAALAAMAVASFRGLIVQAMFELGGAMFLAAMALGIRRRIRQAPSAAG